MSTDFSNFSTPAVWDENAIAGQLGNLRHESPGAITHFIDSIKQRFILNQNDKTAVRRIQFLQKQFELLKLVKSCAEVSVDLEALSKERQIRLKKLDIEARDLDIQLSGDDPLKKLALQRDQLKIQLEIAQIDRQIHELKNPPKPESKPTPDQERAQRKAGIETRIANLRKEQSEAVEAIPETLPEQRRKVSNMYADAIEREMENLRKVL